MAARRPARVRLLARGWEQASRAASPWLAALGFVVLALALVATLSLASFDLMGTVFLGGVLTASVLAALSQAANVRWTLARRTAQLAALRSRLAAESAARSSAERATERMRERERYVDELLPAMIAYVGGDGRLRYHNRAFARWLALDDAEIDGHDVEEVLGESTFRQVSGRLAEAFDGRDVRYERVQSMHDGTTSHVLVQYFPRFAATGAVEGVFAVVTEMSEPRTGDAKGDDARSAGAAARLRAALEGDEFTLHFQPIAPLQCGETPAMGEVLVRMNEEEEKLLPPGGFIPLADELGLLHELDRWIVRHVIELVAGSGGEARIYLVNPWVQTILDADFPAFVRERLAAAGIGGERLCFELAESDLLDHEAACIAFVESLRPAGCRFAICGFGRDARALRVVEAIRADFAKLDAGLVVGMLRDAGCLDRVGRAIRSARGAGLRTIAECVDSEQARAVLSNMGVHLAQGVGIARPRPIPHARPHQSRSLEMPA